MILTLIGLKIILDELILILENKGNYMFTGII